ncbi:Methionyl-tRNA synthetase [Acidisarcina polymorpha]|uniref:Methionine--tRNA ligase n=1 Tax=Acidisarcina polymorpha TaxID=2211140 RepID=A0A2Z5FVQ2_9BACT|nr:methionine--tRNA ligase [Acidisarcina polymorpha]AXC10587.1 Methionyl-tRNA synthetase [Acidisarcina polymorpha]
MPENKYYITTPIYYVNARPHIGHAYSTIVADILARRHRLLGEDTWFLTGTDEHGQKIERSAKAAGKEPQAFTDEVSAQFRGLWDRMGLSYDDFIRTTEPRHKRGVQKLFAELQKRGFIYKGSYSGQYCVFDELYVDTPPGVPCPDCGRPTETVIEENYFFKLSAFERKLLEHYDANPDFIRPESSRKEVISFVKSGLRDLSVSRTSFNWGIPVPGDEKHVIYVWLDALANYMTAVGYGSDAPEDIAKLQKYWPADLHLVGKEITRFHCVYWPAFLMAAGLPLPKSITANGWLLFEESKMSKSRGNIVRAETIVEVLGSDALRYFLMREIPFGQDGSFSFDALVQRYNADLANGYGNLVSRVLAMIEKYFDGKIPPAQAQDGTDLAEDFLKNTSTIQEMFDDLDFSRTLEHLWRLVGIMDLQLTREAPWKKSDGVSEEDHQKQQSEILYKAAEVIRILTALLYPFIPEAASKVWQQLGLGVFKDGKTEKWLPGEYEQLLQWGGLQPGTKLGELGPIFPRADKDAIKRMQELEDKKSQELEQNNAAPAPVTSAEASAPVPTPEALAAAAPTAAPTPAPTEIIGIEDFAKVELRVAQIKVAERIPKADKLLRLEVDLGYETRQILSGIAEYYTPESLIGRKIVIIANLAPRKMRGLESNGMLLAASLGEGDKPVLAGFLEDVPLGARLK